MAVVAFGHIPFRTKTENEVQVIGDDAGVGMQVTWGEQEIIYKMEGEVGEPMVVEGSEKRIYIQTAVQGLTLTPGQLV